METLCVFGIIKIKVPTNNKPFNPIQSADISLVKNKQNMLLAIVQYIRQKIETLYLQVLSTFNTTPLLGIVFGGSGKFTKAEISQFQTAGAIHVITASEINTTLVSGFLLGIFSWFGFFSRRIAIFLTIVGFYLYASIRISSIDSSSSYYGWYAVCWATLWETIQ